MVYADFPGKLNHISTKMTTGEDKSMYKNEDFDPELRKAVEEGSKDTKRILDFIDILHILYF